MNCQVYDGGGLRYTVLTPRAVDAGAPERVVLFLHNRGTCMTDFVPLGAAIDARRTVWILPNAPFAAPADAETGTRAGYTWRAPDEPVLLPAGGPTWSLLTDLVERVTARFGRDVPFVISGFSEGGACALRFGLAHPGRCAGIAVLSAPHLDRFPLPPPDATAATRPPIFLAHGLNDPLVSRAPGIEWATALTALGHDVTYREYAIAHEIDLREIKDVRKWLQHAVAVAPERPRS